MNAKDQKSTELSGNEQNCAESDGICGEFVVSAVLKAFMTQNAPHQV